MRNDDPRRWWALGAIGLSLLTVSVDVTILNVALPTLGPALHASTSDLQWFVDAFTLAMASLLLPAGLLGDRLGRKPMLMASLLLFGLASVWCAYAGSSGELIAARAVLGVSAAFLVPLCTSVLLDIFEGESERTKAIGVIAITQSLGLPLGPIVGGALLNHFWWGSVFLINVPLVAAGLFAVARLVPATRGSRSGRVDLLGILSSSVGLVAIVYGAIEAGEEGWGSAAALVPLLGGLAVLLLFVLWEIRLSASREPLLELPLFHSSGFVWGSVLGTVVTFAMFGLIFALPQYFQAVDGADALGTGLRLLPLIAGVLVSATIVKSAPEAAPRAVPTIGFLMVAAGLFLGTGTTLSSGYGFVATWLVISGFGLGLAMTRTMAAAVNSLSQERSGVGSAVVSAMRQVGGAVGVAVLGTVVNAAYRANLHLSEVPDGVEEAARRSVSSGMALGARMGDPRLVHQVQDAFLTAMQSLLAVCGGIAVVAAALALVFMPKRTLPEEPIGPDVTPPDPDGTESAPGADGAEDTRTTGAAGTVGTAGTTGAAGRTEGRVTGPPAA